PTEMRPTVSDTRVPWISRLRMSRPNWSVPSQWAWLGVCRRSRIATRSGSWGAIRGARHATSTSAARQAAPAGEAPSRRRRRQASDWTRGRARSISGVLDARVDHRVHEVGEQVDGDERHRADQDGALHEGEVAGEDRGDRETAEARPAEDGLGD